MNRVTFKILLLMILAIVAYSDMAHARRYSGGEARFISRDPIGYLGNAEGNLYGYVANRPTMYVDRDGRLAWNTNVTTSNNLPVLKRDEEGPLATTDGSVTIECVCMGHFGNWKLCSVRVSYTINVDFWKDERMYGVIHPGLTSNWVAWKEDDHVKDFKKWAKSTGKPLATTVENTLMAKSYWTASGCGADCKTKNEECAAPESQYSQSSNDRPLGL